MTLSDLPAWAIALLERERVGRLAFLDADDRPRVLPVTFVLAGDALWSAIDRKPKRTAEPARVRWLRRHPEAALGVDHYEDDWERLAWVQVLGRVDVLPLEAGAAGLEALVAKYEPYAKQRPQGPLLRLTVDRALCWCAADQM